MQDEQLTKGKRFYSTSEAAPLLGVSRFTVRQWILRGRIQATRPGNNYRIAASEIKRLSRIFEPQTTIEGE